MVSFTETEAQLSSKTIEHFESFSNLILPKQYKDHLLKYNGGRCEPNVFSFIENGKPTTSSIDWFLALYDGKYDNLKTYFETYKIEQKRLPSHFLPIAHDSGGNLICISCEGNDLGHIFFWDHEKEVDYTRVSDSVYSNIYLIKPTFDEFLNTLISRQ